MSNRTFEEQREYQDVPEDGIATAWSASDLTEALRVAVNGFELEVQAINALNVFPVPDGDTGTNMYLTLKAVCDEIDARGQTADRVDELFGIISRGALMGARGNSGVILYQIIAGLAAGAEGAESLDGSTLSRGLDFASEMAYRAVNNPVEGTMLSVIRSAAESCHQFIETDVPVADVLVTALSAAEEALDQTPDQLAILKQAGVVDAGGQGIVSILRGLTRYARGEAADAAAATGAGRAPSSAREMHFLDQADVVHDVEEYGYCINFTITGENLVEQGFREAIDAIGTSTVIVGDENMLKIHTHSEHPGTILEAALTFGELHDIRIDNMAAQTQRLLDERQAIAADRDAAHAATEAYVSSIGVVAVGAGDGIINALKGMGAHAVVSGGTSMNPSTNEIREVIDSLDLDEIIVLPNDANILASARHAAELVEKTVKVVPTKSVQEGIAALSAFNFSASLNENAEAMAEAMSFVRSLAVARASRDAQIDDLQFRAGEFMGMIDGKPRVTGPDIRSLVIDLLATAGASDYELATVFVGGDAGRALLDDLECAIADEYPDLDVEITEGGQPHYDLLIALE